MVCFIVILKTPKQVNIDQYRNLLTQQNIKCNRLLKIFAYGVDTFRKSAMTKLSDQQLAFSNQHNNFNILSKVIISPNG